MERLISKLWRLIRAVANVGVLGVVVVSGTLAASSPSGTIAATASKSHSGALRPQDESTSYVIGPGDTLQVYVWNNPDLTVTIPVRPDGRISTPLVENMLAVGKTPSQLARDIEKVLAVYIRSPKVNIIVTKPVGALTEIKVIGQVTKPGALPYHAGMRVLDAVLDAGGLTQFAAGNRATIIREESGGERKIEVKLGRLLEKGDMSQNLLLEPNDVIVVPESLF